MAKKAKPGDCIKGYEITQLLNVGAMAISYAARSSSGRKVFLKQYKSPSITVPWYRGYVKYQAELKRRIESSAAKSFSYEFIDFFEAKFGHQTYFQVFEFVDGGEDLESIIARIRDKPESVTWEQRLTFAKVLLAGLNSLHEAGVVHCDLKPANIQLFEDESIAAGYRLKLIDMDFSILNDKLAPWDGHQGYVGSPNYFSPEHLRGQSPLIASDVFTSGLILYELLAQGHPYLSDDESAYLKAVNKGKPSVAILAGGMPEPARDDDVAKMLFHALRPNPEHRPTAKDLNLVLNGKAAADDLVKSIDDGPIELPESIDPKPVPPAPVPPKSTPRTASVLELVAESGQRLRLGITTSVGKHLCKSLGEDSTYMSNPQFTVVRDATGIWQLRPDLGAKNETLLNGKAVREIVELQAGDVIGVGRESKGIVKLPLTVQFV